MKFRTNLKRMLCVLMVLLTVAAYVPMTVSAAEEIKSNGFVTTTGELQMECALFPIRDSVYISRTNKKLDYKWKDSWSAGGHVKYAFDFVARKDKKFRAPFDLKLLYVDKSNDHAVVFQSIGKVRLANGKFEHITGLVLHDNDVSDLKAGQTYKQGVHFYTQGDYGNATGPHIHIELALGKLTVDKNNYLSIIRKNGIHANQVFFLTDKTKLDTHKVTNPSSRKTETLKWERVSCVSFNANGGTVSPASHYYRVNKTYLEVPVPKRSGYKFTGWNTKADGKGEKITHSSPVTKGDKTLYAQWSVIDKNKLYYVTYNKNGGTGTMSDVEVLANEYFLSGPNKFTRKGYVFKGWNLRRKSDNKWYISGKGWKSDSQIKLYNYSKKLYKDNYKYKLDSYWTNGSAKNEIFVLYAVWSKCSGHKWDSGKVTTASTTDKTGVKTYTCTLCKETKTETIPKTIIVKSWDYKAVEKLSQTDAQIKARANFTKKVKCTQAGFYFGTDKNNLKKNAKYDSINYSNTYIDMWFLMSKYGQKLTAGKTYYYKFYVIADGKTYYSDVKSFTTKPATTSVVKSWDYKAVEKLSQTDAQIKARANFTKKVKCTQGGFYFGTDKNNLKKNAKYDSINYSNTYIDMWFLMSKYGQKLTAGKTYYYKFYVIADGKTYYSDVKSFTTKPATTSVVKSWDIKAVEKLSKTDAQIKARANFTKKVKCTQGGFYFGTDKNNLKKNAKYDSINYSNTYIDMWFLMSKYGQKLTAGKTYYYKFYVIADGKTYYSDVRSFTTKK